MTSNCGNVHHRTIEGVLTYLNAFLLLDYARDITGTNKLLGVVVLLVITIIALWYMRRHCGVCACANPVVNGCGDAQKSAGPIMVPPSPEEGLASDDAYSYRSYKSTGRR